MHPVLPSTTVRGPAAFTISFITRADSQPWQVRCPEVKNSSSGSFFTPLNASSFCVPRRCVSSASSLSVVAIFRSPCARFVDGRWPRLLAQADPLGQGLRLASSRLVDLLAHLAHVRDGH